MRRLGVAFSVNANLCSFRVRQIALQPLPRLFRLGENARIMQMRTIQGSSPRLHYFFGAVYGSWLLLNGLLTTQTADEVDESLATGGLLI